MELCTAGLRGHCPLISAFSVFLILGASGLILHSSTEWLNAIQVLGFHHVSNLLCHAVAAISRCTHDNLVQKIKFANTEMDSESELRTESFQFVGRRLRIQLPVFLLLL